MRGRPKEYIPEPGNAAIWLECCPLHPGRECAAVGGAYYCGRCRAYYSATGAQLHRETPIEETPPGASSPLARAIALGGADL